MTDAPFQSLARLAGAVAVFLGSVVFLGWTVDVDIFKHVLPSLGAMKVNTAVV